MGVSAKLATRRPDIVAVNDAPGPSSAPPRGFGRGSTRNKVAQILSNTLGAILPHMRRSFVDKQYLPSTGMDQSEWKIILEELTHMGYIVKKEPESEDDD
jgi:hypothetical protein